MTSFLEQAAGAATGALLGLFGYNRDNFQYDRTQRMLMEFQLAEMRIKQVGLWREDVRNVMELTPRKMEVYLLVIALELNATATALCKARVPPGSPPWLCACHTLAACSALMYLILGLWFGLHAFVAAQAFKVRILTQVVRLPIPTWASMEASRTYSSAFEKLGRNQMLRVPFAEGPQESRCIAPAPGGGGAADQAMPPSDPWGLERNGEDIRELQPGVNTTHVEQQRHIWHVREAARFYQTYDAFCRVCLSAGTSSLATFFSFFCLSYVLTENAAPIAAWAGMLVFAGISVLLIGNDLRVSRWQLFRATFLLLSSPILTAIVTFMSSRNRGDPGKWEWLMPIALFNKGAWFMYYLYIFKVKEMQTGTILPTAFKGVLFVDPFGWAKHSPREHQRQVTMRASGLPQAQSGHDIRGDPPGALPWRYFLLNTIVVTSLWWVASGVSAWNAWSAPTIFVPPKYGLQPREVAKIPLLIGEKVETGWSQGVVERPHGLSCDNAGSIFVTSGRNLDGRRSLLQARFSPGVPGSSQPGRGGRRSGAAEMMSVHFEEAPRCPALDSEDTQIQDLALANRCSRQTISGNGTGWLPAGCAVLVLPHRGARLVPCPLWPQSSEAATAAGEAAGAPLGCLWLEELSALPSPPCGGASRVGCSQRERNMEELSALAVVPCANASRGGSTQREHNLEDGDCAIVGTTAKRVVLLGTPLAGAQGHAQPDGVAVPWVPRRLIRPADSEVLEAGALALLNGRFLGQLDRRSGVVHVADLRDGRTGAWRLPEHSGWAAMCAGGDAFFVLEDKERPSLWRFPAPPALLEL